MDKVTSYYKEPRVSNSMLNAISNPKLFREMQLHPEKFEDNDDKPYFRIGSAVDCLLTDAERFDKDFEVVDIVRPPEAMVKFIHNLPKGLSQLSSPEDYKAAYEASGYKISLDKIIEKLWMVPQNKLYYEYLSRDREIITRDEYDKIITIRNTVLNNETTRGYFIPQSLTIELLHQVPIYFTYKSVECKSLLDGIKIDHEHRTIEPFDLKTTSRSVYEFQGSFVTYNYYRQSAFYDLAVRSESSPVKIYLDEGYQLLDFVFIVAETRLDTYNPPIIYVTSKYTRHLGLSGGVDRFGKKIMGIDNLIDQYVYCKDNDYWELPIALKESNLRVQLEL